MTKKEKLSLTPEPIFKNLLIYKAKQNQENISNLKNYLKYTMEKTNDLEEKVEKYMSQIQTQNCIKPSENFFNIAKRNLLEKSEFTFNEANISKQNLEQENMEGIVGKLHKTHDIYEASVI